MARPSTATALLVTLIGVFALAGASCPMDPGGMVFPPGPQPFDPEQGVSLILVNDAGAPLEAVLRYYLNGAEVRHTVYDLQPTGMQQSVDALPTRADRVTIVATMESAIESGRPKSGAAREIIADIELLLSRDYVFGDTLTIRLTPPPPQPVPPIANAGPDKLAVAGQPVSLDGSGSQSTEGGALTFNWEQISGPVVALNNATTATPDFVAPGVTAQATLVFRLTVTEGDLSASDEVQVLVRPDCNANAVADGDDIASGQSPDCNGDGVPDECQLVENDCNQDGIPDDCQLAGNDCNEDGVPDDCQLGSNDCNENGVPDECDTDCDRNGIPDVCDFEAPDCDENGVPDACDPEAADIEAFVAALLSDYPPKYGFPCHFDANHDGTVNGLDVQPYTSRLLQQLGP